MAKDKIVLLGEDDVISFSGLVADLKAEHKIPVEAEWTYLVKIVPLNGVYMGAWLYLDGPIVPHSSGRSPAYRKYVYVSADWAEERIFNTIGELYIFLRDKIPLFRRCPYSKVEHDSLRFQEEQVAVVDLSTWAR